MRYCLRVTWPLLLLAAFAAAAGYAADTGQAPARVGFVHPPSPSTASGGINAFWERMRQLGHEEGKNLTIEARWAEGRYDRVPTLLKEVLARKVDVLVTYGAPVAAAAKNATTEVPIVGVALGDPLRIGLVKSLVKHEDNLTGLSVGWSEGITGKWLELLQETVPRLTTVAVIGNPNNAITRDLVKELEAVAPTRNLRLRLIEVPGRTALDSAFEQVRQKSKQF